MKEQYKGLKPDGTPLAGSLLLDTNNRKERERILKDYKHLSGAEKIVKVYDGKRECYEEVTI